MFVQYVKKLLCVVIIYPNIKNVILNPKYHPDQFIDFLCILFYSWWIIWSGCVYFTSQANYAMDKLCRLLYRFVKVEKSFLFLLIVCCSSRHKFLFSPLFVCDFLYIFFSFFLRETWTVCFCYTYALKDQYI
jgi:hypothetical protein